MAGAPGNSRAPSVVESVSRTFARQERYGAGPVADVARSPDRDLVVVFHVFSPGARPAFRGGSRVPVMRFEVVDESRTSRAFLRASELGFCRIRCRRSGCPFVHPWSDSTALAGRRSDAAVGSTTRIRDECGIAFRDLLLEPCALSHVASSLREGGCAMNSLTVSVRSLRKALKSGSGRYDPLFRGSARRPCRSPAFESTRRPTAGGLPSAGAGQAMEPGARVWRLSLRAGNQRLRLPDEPASMYAHPARESLRSGVRKDPLRRGYEHSCAVLCEHSALRQLPNLPRVMRRNRLRVQYSRSPPGLVPARRHDAPTNSALLMSPYRCSHRAAATLGDTASGAPLRVARVVVMPRRPDSGRPRVQARERRAVPELLLTVTEARASVGRWLWPGAGRRGWR